MAKHTKRGMPPEMHAKGKKKGVRHSVSMRSSSTDSLPMKMGSDKSGTSGIKNKFE